MIIKKTIRILICFIALCIIKVNFSYAKSLDLSGISIRLTTEKETKETYNGVNVKEGIKYSDTEYEKEEKEPKDKSVIVNLSIINNNLYEDAKITIKENVPNGFRKNGTNNNTSSTNITLSKGENRTWVYDYKYDKKFLKDQYKSLVYDENGNLLEEANIKILDKENDVNIYDEKNIIYKEFSNNDKSIEEIEKGVHKKSNIFIIIVCVFFIAVFFFFAFLLIFRKLRDINDNSNIDKFNVILLCLISSLLIQSFLKVAYASSYVPNIYSNKEEFKKVIYESTTFNDRIYRFEYEITVKFTKINTFEYSDIDTDLDGLSDYDEYMYMTDINNKDTDNDGLSDYIEVKILHYNPLSYDTFNDSRNDANRDYDGDGLSNIKEVELGTSLTNEDTDGDTLSDYDEVYEFMTDPLLLDTDGDTLFDNIELKLGLDPTTMYSDGVTLDSERKIEQKLDLMNVPKELTTEDIQIIGIEGSVNGFIDDNIKIKNYHSNNFDNVTALVSNTFNIINENNNKISIRFDASRVSDRIDKLILCKYENGEFIPIDTDFSGDTLEAEVDSGIYGVLDSEYILRDMNIYISDYLH